MQTYNCKVCHGGSLYNEVPVFDVTMPEIAVLRVIHGDDAIKDVRIATSVQRTDGEERERLQNRYGAALSKKRDVRNINGLFGVGTPLPIEVDGVTVIAPARKEKAPRPSKAEVEDDTFGLVGAT